LVWFIQQEGRPIPEEMTNKVADSIRLASMASKLHGLILVDFMLACFSRETTASALLGSLSQGASTQSQISQPSLGSPILAKPDFQGDSSL